MFTPAQWTAIAYVPKPSAALSLLSSLYVIYTVLVKHPEKRGRMYHRLVLGMNFHIVPQSLVFFFGTWATPKELASVGVVGASGTTATCTAQGVFLLIFGFTVPFYYASLSLYAYVAVRNNFQEERYRWMEKYFHIGSFFFPVVTAIVMAAKKFINPSGPWCFIDTLPPGCNHDPRVPCIRGDETTPIYSWIFAFGQVAFYLILATATMISLYIAVRRTKLEGSPPGGKTKIIEEARQSKSRKVILQAGLYLGAFYITYIFGIITRCVKFKTGTLLFWTNIVSTFLIPLQGFIIMIAYLRLQRRSSLEDKKWFTYTASMTRKRQGGDLRCTVSEIRRHADAEDCRRMHLGLQDADAEEKELEQENNKFCIFDGTPDPTSPWAQYMNEDESGDEEQNEDTPFSDEPDEINESKLPP